MVEEAKRQEATVQLVKAWQELAANWAQAVADAKAADVSKRDIANWAFLVELSDEEREKLLKKLEGDLRP